jgi:hypothetical protein
MTPPVSDPSPTVFQGLTFSLNVPHISFLLHFLCVVSTPWMGSWRITTCRNFLIPGPSTKVASLCEIFPEPLCGYLLLGTPMILSSPPAHTHLV